MSPPAALSSHTMPREIMELVDNNAPELEVLNLISCPSTGSSPFQDYDIMEHIGSGRISEVYLVNCRRGRLRNRQLALRKVSISRADATELSRSKEQDNLHQSLYHPCIISLFSSFSTPSARFQLLELCSGGTVANYIDDNPMTEGHLRGVLKSLMEALVYLKKQGVVHRTITPSNVLLTTDGRIKLGDFHLATHLPPSRIPAEVFMEAPHFVAPEILADLPYTCDADLWSVGCIALACLLGRRPFEANSNSETVDKILNASYVLPKTTSLEIQDLVVRVLEIDPVRRIQLSIILSHPFFDIKFPVVLLRSTMSRASESVLSKHALFESNSGLPKPPVSTFPSTRPKPPRHSFAPNKTVADDIRNTHRRDALLGEVPARRIVSDPLPLKQRHLASDAEPSSSSRFSQDKTPQQPHRRIDRGVGVTDGVVEPREPVCYSVSSPPTIPVGTTRPLPFTTALLSPEVHKTVHGQITVFPSCSLLVDLREGERRRGQKGAEVLLINSQGTEIEIYGAPHLSLPCCLTEPIKRHIIEDLPSAYWRQYNDAGLLVERIKQRTPKLILHTGAAKCTLMANAPPADIELLFGLSGSQSRRKTDQSAETFVDAPRMRLRLSRQCGSLEIAKHISGARGEEWTKKVVKTIDENPHISTADWETLDATEQDSIAHLARFWRICEVLEQLESEDPPASPPSTP
ncbi:kinase-like domain-containing protein [Mycena latifolia]|nr:kinase-like domain-containing protein [Mycena latifolia]